MKHFLKLGTLLLMLLLFLNCEKQDISKKDDTELINSKKYILTRIKQNEISKNTTLFSKIKELENNKEFLSKLGKYENTEFNLNLNEAAYIESLDGSFHSYTFYIDSEVGSYDINNIVLVSYNNGIDYQAYISTYTLTFEERIQLLNGNNINFDQRASIDYFNINQINTYSRDGEGGGGCFDLVFVRSEDCACHEVHAEGGCTHPEDIYEWQEVECPGGGGSGGSGDGSGTSGGTAGGGGSSGGDSGDETIPTTPMYPDGTSAAPDFLIDAFGGASQLTSTQLDWINNSVNDQLVNQILNFLSQTGNTSDSHTFALDIIDLKPKDSNALAFILEAKAQNKMESELDDAFFLATSQYLDAYNYVSYNPIINAQLASYFSVKCAVLRYNHPDWSDIRIYWEASKDLVHIVLDGFGMIPVFGEVADLTNGILYLIEGDGLNATLSFAATVPIAGWTATGAKYAIKIVDTTQTASTIITKVRLTWKVVGNTIDFGSRNQLRKVLGLAVGNSDQAHHLIPWISRTHEIIQRAAKSGSAFHMNEALNGIAVAAWRNQPNHNAYNNLIQTRLNNYLLEFPNASPQQCHNFVSSLIQDIRNWVVSNPNSHLNDLVLP
ncbi:MAG: hypothetical protein CMP76_10695 [Flavobacterium sp.]|uniref:AHH domain-containing protein n=1 Tax=Flavobacterium sp. TaxID=239 RepID=UPI000C5F7665|nr:AHH domain-containing protein [Flavobacterium sp.]MBF03751.1 hypothetical protein [Flavobacterium sp.]|tara:strand:+ start:2448 stop:4274 length:1827 start_codon:yes stop_codon:yes gene_type:complete